MSQKAAAPRGRNAASLLFCSGKEGVSRLLTVFSARRVACEDRPGLLLDITEHLKAQQVGLGASRRRKAFIHPLGTRACETGGRD